MSAPATTRGAPGFAGRVGRLGDETAFTSAAEAASAAATGQKVYPFHLGNVDLPTPRNILEAMDKAIRDGKTGYCPNPGIAELREAIAEDVGRARDLEYGGGNVAVQPGGKPVIGKFLLTFLDPGDEVLYPNPGFPIYSSLIAFLGGCPVPYTYRETATGFALDMDGLRDQITSRTRLLILNDLHNPTGAECSADELEQVAEVAREHDLRVLCDEAYFDVRLDGGRSRSLASLPGMQERCVILYTFSKKYAMGGWRLGAAIAPADVIEVFTKLNTNLESCTNHFVQYAGVEALTGDQSGSQRIMTVLRERRNVAHRILSSIEGVTCHKPDTTFYLYPDVTDVMRRMGFESQEELRRALLKETGVSVCTRSQFGDPLEGETRSHLRIAYSGIGVDQIEEGLTGMKAFLERTL
jgi:aspartate/methionine/tyrosine aminotransferase